MTFFQHECIDNILDHQNQTVNPKNINDNIIFILKSKAKQWPSDKDDVLHIVEEEDPRTVEFLEDLLHETSPPVLKFGVPSERWLSPFLMASCSAS